MGSIANKNDSSKLHIFAKFNLESRNYVKIIEEKIVSFPCFKIYFACDIVMNINKLRER